MEKLFVIWLIARKCHVGYKSQSPFCKCKNKWNRLYYKKEFLIHEKKGVIIIFSEKNVKIRLHHFSLFSFYVNTQKSLIEIITF